MTEIEAKKIIEGKLACMTKCGVFEREKHINSMDCDECSYCYEQGNFGQQKEALQVAIQALEKKIPKKPDCIEDKMCCCPVSDNHLMHKWIKYPTRLMPKTEGLPCCMSCGQAIDWSDEE